VPANAGFLYNGRKRSSSGSGSGSGSSTADYSVQFSAFGD